jgi:hypothetical protein
MLTQHFFCYCHHSIFFLEAMQPHKLSPQCTVKRGEREWNPADPLRIQVMSDLHLEFPLAPDRFPQVRVFSCCAVFTSLLQVLQETYGVEGDDLPVLGHCLALLGDIGYPAKEGYAEFVLAQAKRFDHVFIVAGNHEFYRYLFRCFLSCVLMFATE